MRLEFKSLFAATALMVFHVSGAAALDCNRWAEFDVLSQAPLSQARTCIAQQSDLNVVGTQGFTPLSAAIFNNRPDVATLLVKAGADVNASGVDAYAPLHWAVLTAHVPTIKLLLNAGADANHRDGDKSTALHQAAEVDFDLKMIRLLLQSGADPRAKDKHGQTPVHKTLARNPNVAALQMLIDAGFETNYVDPKYGYSYLHWAVYNNDPEKVSVMLDAGVDARLKNYDGKTAADMAENKPHLSEVYARMRQAEK